MPPNLELGNLILFFFLKDRRHRRHRGSRTTVRAAEKRIVTPSSPVVTRRHRGNRTTVKAGHSWERIPIVTRVP